MKHTYKLFFTLILVLLSVLLVTGCSSGEESANAKEDKQSSEDQVSNTVEEAKKLNKLTVQAPMGISIATPIYKLIHDGNLQTYTDELEFLPWKNPDELRARISSNQADVSAVPTYVGANLYNRGMDVKLLNTLIWGILYVIGPDGEATSLEELKGETVYVPFKGDMPDLVLQYLLEKQKIEDIKLEYVSSPQEIVQLLVSGKAKYAVAPEHVATLSVIKGKKAGKSLTKVISLQEEWKHVTGRDAYIPQAGILVSNELIENHPELVNELQVQFKEGLAFINENPTEAASIIQTFNDGVPVPVIEKVIPSLNLKFVSAQEAKEELEFFFNELSTLSPEIIGGKLPDEGFYYSK